METYEKNGDQIKKTITKEQVFSQKELEAKLNDLKKQIEQIEKLPDEIMVPNEQKQIDISILSNRKEEIESILWPEQ